jgi:hypothetical protein
MPSSGRAEGFGRYLLAGLGVRVNVLYTVDFVIDQLVESTGVSDF